MDNVHTSMVESYLTRYRDMDFIVSDLLQVLRWAKVAANKKLSKAALQELWTTMLFDGGPPPLLSPIRLTTMPPEWQKWLERHFEWQNSSNEVAFRNELINQNISVPQEATHQVLIDQDSEASNKSVYNVFEKRARRNQPQLSIGTIHCICFAAKLVNGALDGLPYTRQKAIEFQQHNRSKTVLWGTWASLKKSVPATKTLRDWYFKNDSMREIVNAVHEDCRVMGFEATFHNLLRRKIPFPVSMHQILNKAEGAQFLVSLPTSKTRAITRKRKNLFNALEEFVSVSNGTCVVVHINGHKPEQSFVRVHRPDEKYFATGSSFDTIAQLVQKMFDTPRDAKKFLQSLQLLNTQALRQQSRRLVAEACGEHRSDWAQRPHWVPDSFLWEDPSHMTKTTLLQLCHYCLEHIFCPNYCGRVSFENNAIVFLDDVA
ncbi:Aste57867_2296 [Aphanomyces stellatus]|uniref:Aste57867_2296 protein n=1 Tax=Aphanomyces stellatus TaxID=120398 RepID=A0A485KBK0_9STRA|nr:hypothetical protein As57867_002291 [Aphanomyces stellatus]VFT79499.1 Aste57867_2296 [Aphanomyces stellatus]